MEHHKVAEFGVSCGYHGSVWKDTVWTDDDGYHGPAGDDMDQVGLECVPGFCVDFMRADHYGHGNVSHTEWYTNWNDVVAASADWIQSGNRECWICQRDTHTNYIAE